MPGVTVAVVCCCPFAGANIGTYHFHPLSRKRRAAGLTSLLATQPGLAFLFRNIHLAGTFPVYCWKGISTRAFTRDFVSSPFLTWPMGVSLPWWRIFSSFALMTRAIPKLGCLYQSLLHGRNWAVPTAGIELCPSAEIRRETKRTFFANTFHAQPFYNTISTLACRLPRFEFKEKLRESAAFDGKIWQAMFPTRCPGHSAHFDLERAYLDANPA